MLSQPPILNYEVPAAEPRRPVPSIAVAVSYYFGTIILLGISLFMIVATGDAEAAGYFPVVAAVFLAIFLVPALFHWLAIFLLWRVAGRKPVRKAALWSFLLSAGGMGLWAVLCIMFAPEHDMDMAAGKGIVSVMLLVILPIVAAALVTRRENLVRCSDASDSGVAVD